MVDEGGAVAEWSKALLVRENKTIIKKIPGSPPTWAPFKKKVCMVDIRLEMVRAQFLVSQDSPELA